MTTDMRIRILAFLLNLQMILLLPASLRGGPKSVPEFEYVGGTEPISEGSKGKLEITQSALVFACAQGAITAPYHSIEFMEYRSQVSKRVRKMKLPWAVRPPSRKAKHNRYFTVIFSYSNVTRVMVLKVLPDTMRPYLAEIDLRTGHRVEVQRYY